MQFLRNIIIGAALLLAAFCTGIYVGEVRSEKAAVVSVAKADKKVVEGNKNLQGVADKAEASAVTAEVQTKVVYKTITKEVIKYVESNPSADVRLDPEWVRIFNASSRACSPTEPSCVPDGENAKGATAGEVLPVAVEQHEMYQQCVDKLSGLQDFYTELQKQQEANP